MTSLSMPIGFTNFDTSGATLLRTLRPLFRTVTASVSTLTARGLPPAWFASVTSQLLDMSVDADFVDEPALIRALRFLESLPEAMPEPFVAIGDDGSVGIEWEENAGHLYLTFAATEDEVYWCSAAGAEWEAPLRQSISPFVDAMFDLMKD
jgi:hypothetical protein